MKIRKRRMANGFVWQADIFDATGKRVRKSFRDRHEAKQWLAEQTIEAGKPQPVPAANRDVTLQAYWDEWEPQQAAIEPSTLDSYRYLFTRHVAPMLGGVRIRDIHRGHIRTLLATKRQSLSGNSTRLIRATLSVLLGDAVGDGIINENPARVLAQERRKRPDRVSKAERTKHLRPLSREHLAVVLVTATARCAPRDAAVYLTLADTGLRPSEALALRWEDVDLVTRTLRVERSLSSTGTIKATKTERPRDVDLTRRLADTLGALQASAEAEALTSGTEPSPSLFTTADGGFLERRSVTRRFRELLSRAKLPKHRLYDLRHNAASRIMPSSWPDAGSGAGCRHRASA